ncbi:hypothetical protein QIH93_15060 [Bradyrhizobium ottawaense]|uniref:hypothetical protein n=1 Tax=Bradyrhizobium ottawaense TaxID=931866 RepID=UPI002714FBD9|nr:hypothetical protein [Bradyrhizobium ottawaense]WLB49232.1 hypothetical protein QIH93_15060 [Bradyrhizobium ottawaense]
MARQSQIPAGENLSRPMQAYLEKIESRVPSNTTPLATDGSVTLVELIAAYNQLIQDLNK